MGGSDWGGHQWDVDCMMGSRKPILHRVRIQGGWGPGCIRSTAPFVVLSHREAFCAVGSWSWRSGADDLRRASSVSALSMSTPLDDVVAIKGFPAISVPSCVSSDTVSSCAPGGLTPIGDCWSGVDGVGDKGGSYVGGCGSEPLSRDEGNWEGEDWVPWSTQRLIVGVRYFTAH